MTSDHRPLEIEIPSIEHPDLMTAALDEAAARGVAFHRASQGGGPELLTDAELDEFVTVAHAAEVAVFLFMASRGTLEYAGGDADEGLRGRSGLEAAVAQARRCERLGVDGIIIADVGLLSVLGELRAGHAGEPALKLDLKTAAAIAPRNPATASLYERLGATSINVSAADSPEHLREIREALKPETRIDIYVESPGNKGMRYREARALARDLAPVTLKIGLSGTARLNPYGTHLRSRAEAEIREKVRRVELLEQHLNG